MSEVLVLVEHADGDVKKVTFELLTLARRLGEPSAVVIGPGAGSAAASLGEYGAAKVYVVEDPGPSAYLVAPAAEVLAKLVADASPAAVLLASGAEGKEIAARLALKTGSGLITDATDVSAGTVVRSPSSRSSAARRSCAPRSRPARRSSRCGRTRSPPSQPGCRRTGRRLGRAVRRREGREDHRPGGRGEG